MAPLRTEGEYEQGSHACTMPFLMFLRTHVCLGVCSCLGAHVWRRNNLNIVPLKMVALIGLLNNDGSAGQCSENQGLFLGSWFQARATISTLYLCSIFRVVSGDPTQVPTHIPNLTSSSPAAFLHNYWLYFFLKVPHHARKVRFTTLPLSWPATTSHQDF